MMWMQRSLKQFRGFWAPAGSLLLPIIMLTAIILLTIGLLSWTLPLTSQLELGAGQVAPYDVVAPRQITYVSEILTEQARERASNAIPDQYDSAEGRVRREQVVRSREVLATITALRDDDSETAQEKLHTLLAIADLSLSIEAATLLLSLDAEEWSQVVAESPLALDRAMREEIRQATLLSAQRRAAFNISSDLSEDAATAATEVVRALIRPNSFYNEERTVEMRNAASAAVAPVPVTLERGETILRAGDVATPEDVEALRQIGLLGDEWEWTAFVRTVAFTILIVTITAAGIYRLRPSTAHNSQELATLILVTVLWLFAAKFMIVPHDWVPYLYPLAALSMLVACLVDLRVSVMLTLAFALIVHYIGDYNPVLVVYAAAGGVAGAVVVGRPDRLTAFLWAGLVVVISNILAMVAYRFPFDSMSSPQTLQVLFVVVINGGLSASIALIGYFALGSLFGIITSLHLNELSRPTHPLLRQLLLKAPGTYHHTIVVSNLAERGAAAIGADALLARVGAYYHDIGKIVRPYFFTENMAEGASPHEKLDPLTSAQIIINHVIDGVNLAQKYGLPQRIQDFIREHHGRSLVYYFYARAVADAAGKEPIDPEQFRYPGPRPTSKETAILLLADTCEAAVRAMRPANREGVATLVNRLIDERIADGEINDSHLTLNDLEAIKQVFTQVLQGVHHPRVSYPQIVDGQNKTLTPNGAGQDAVMGLREVDTGDVSIRPGIEEISILRTAPIDRAL
jgi:hypothetical protein